MGGRNRDQVAWVLCVLALAAVLWPVPGRAATRVALVVGNSAYEPKALPNPVNDATLMAEALETSGFEVRLVTDADQGAMKAAIKAFGRRLVEAGDDAVGLFYFAGHGVEDKGLNYLIPVASEIESELDLDTDAVLVEWVLARMKRAGNRLNMVILDACRDNPLAGRYRGGSEGLGQMDAPSGTLIAYAAAPGQKAKDGEGENSPYTAALADALIVPGLRVEDVFKRVRVAVEAATNGEQTPWENSSLRGDFYFVAKVEEPAPQPEAVPVGPSDLTRQELAARGYEAAERIHTIAGYELVIEQFPGTLYAKLAAEQIEKLKGDETPAGPSAEEAEASLGLKRAERERVQMGLRSLGFNPGSPDGLFGPQTRGAIEAWQRANGHAATRYLTREQAGTILAEVPLTAHLRPKCAELPGQYLGEDHAECWQELAGRPGCHYWTDHYHSDRTATWSGQCRNGVAQGRGTLTRPSGSEHASYEGTGTLADGRQNGSWVEEWADGDRYEGGYRDGKLHGRGTLTWASGQIYEGEWQNNKSHGQGTCTDAEVTLGDSLVYSHRYEGEWREGKWHGWGVRTQAVLIKWDEPDDDGEIGAVRHSRYEGGFRDGKIHGRGTYSKGVLTAIISETADWSRYEGEWHRTEHELRFSRYVPNTGC